MRHFPHPQHQAFPWIETSSLPEPLGPSSNLAQRTVGKAIQTLVFTAIVWAVFLGINAIFDVNNEAFWFAFIFFGILGPIGVAFTAVKTSVMETKLGSQGVDVGQYIPLFVHQAGITKLADKQGTYVAALKSSDDLVFFSCESWLCKERKKDFLGDFKSEVARIRIRDIESVFAVPAEIDVSDRTSTEISEFLVNNTLGSLLGRKRHTMFYDAFIVIVVSRPSRQQLVFAVPNKIADAPILSTLLHFVPEEVSKTFERLDITHEAIEALTVEAEDPEAVKNAKKVAVEILGLKARLAA